MADTYLRLDFRWDKQLPTTESAYITEDDYRVGDVTVTDVSVVDRGDSGSVLSFRTAAHTLTHNRLQSVATRARIRTNNNLPHNVSSVGDPVSIRVGSFMLDAEGREKPFRSRPPAVFVRVTGQADTSSMVVETAARDEFDTRIDVQELPRGYLIRPAAQTISAAQALAVKTQLTQQDGVGAELVYCSDDTKAPDGDDSDLLSDSESA